MRMLVALCTSLVSSATAAYADRAPTAPSRTAPAATVPRAQAPRTPAVNLEPIVVADLPEKCRAIGKQAQSPTLSVALGARIALAGCLAEHAIAALELMDTGESIVAVNEATTRSFALYDEVAAAGDKVSAILALAAKADLYATMRTRMLSTIPAPDATPESIALRDARKQFLELQLQPWVEAARTASERVVELAKTSPDLMKNPVVQTAVRASQQRLAMTVATRDEARDEGTADEATAR
jgi:hypothetical protein